MFKPVPGKQYIIELGINSGIAGDAKPKITTVAIGPGVPPFFDVQKSSKQMLEQGNHQLLFEYTPQNADPVVITLWSDSVVMFHYCRILSIG